MQIPVLIVLSKGLSGLMPEPPQNLEQQKTSERGVTITPITTVGKFENDLHQSSLNLFSTL